MTGYDNLRRLGLAGIRALPTRTAGRVLGGLGLFEEILAGVNIALKAGGEAFGAYTELEKLNQQEDALKLQRQKLASEQAVLAEAKLAAEQMAQNALLADREAASAGIAAAAQAESGVPAWAWVVGAAALGGGAIYLLNRKRRR